MGMLTVDLSMSLDGYIAGPNPSLEAPLGQGGDQLHEWTFGLKAWREPHGLDGGDTTPDNDVVEEARRGVGATIMGRQMYSGGSGPWLDDPNAGGWWGDEPPFKHPVFVLTHHAREPASHHNGTSYTFVTDGIESALEQARAVAGDRNIHVAGGADVIQQYLRAGLVDELQLHLVPVILGSGVRLFDNLAGSALRLGLDRVVDSPTVTHLRYRTQR